MTPVDLDCLNISIPVERFGDTAADRTTELSHYLNVSVNVIRDWIAKVSPYIADFGRTIRVRLTFSFAMPLSNRILKQVR